MWHVTAKTEKLSTIWFRSTFQKLVLQHTQLRDYQTAVAGVFQFFLPFAVIHNMTITRRTSNYSTLGVWNKLLFYTSCRYFEAFCFSSNLIRNIKSTVFPGCIFQNSTPDLWLNQTYCIHHAGYQAKEDVYIASFCFADTQFKFNTYPTQHRRSSQ